VFIPFFVHFYQVTLFGMTWRWAVIVHALPPIVFFLFFLVLVLVNPILIRLAPGLRLRRRELMLILCMWLLATAIGWTSLTTSAMHAIGETANYATMEGQSPHKVDYISYLKPDLMISAEDSYTYHFGLSPDEKRISPRRIPFRLWLRPLAYWIPLMLVVIVFSTSLVQIVHRQWSQHELLSYPIADFAGSLLTQRQGRSLPRIFYDRIFWVGFAITAFIFTLHNLNAWFPLMVKIPLSYSHRDLMRQFSFLNKYCGREAYSLFRAMIYPYIIGLAVFLPTEVSLTCWLGYALMIFATGFYFLLTSEVIGHTQTLYMQSGMYVAIVIMLIAIGRREYLRILRYAFTFRRTGDEAIRRAAAACRVFVLAFIALWAMLAFAGLHWLVALVLCCSLALILVILARFMAEVGLPWLVSFWQMSRFMPLKMFGTAALGPKSLAVMAVIGMVLDADTMNTVTAQQTTIGRLEEGQGRGLKRWQVNLVLLITALVVFAASIFTSLWHNYTFGAQKERSCGSALQSQMNTVATDIRLMDLEGKLSAATGATTGGKLGLVQSAPGFWRFFLYGAVVIALCGFMRLRFAWWPFHPLPLLLIDTWCMSRMYMSFFLAWLIKLALLKIGGGKVFMRSKSFFVGVILGQLVTGSVWVMIGAIYHLITGIKPEWVTHFV